MILDNVAPLSNGLGLRSGPRSTVMELRSIYRQYGVESAVHALTDVDLSVDEGDWMAITGPSGSGKSTLLNILGCLDRPTSGSYRLDGIETTELSDNQRAGLRSQRIGFVFQSFHLLPYRTVLENVMLAEVYRRRPFRGRRERAIATIERVGLAHRADFLPTKLSGGERQRVAIARALVGRPAIVLADEPTGNVDSAAGASILGLLQQLNADGATIVVITHDRAIAARLPRQLYMLDGLIVTDTADRGAHAGSRA